MRRSDLQINANAVLMNDRVTQFELSKAVELGVENSERKFLKQSLYLPLADSCLRFEWDIFCGRDNYQL